MERPKKNDWFYIIGTDEGGMDVRCRRKIQFVVAGQFDVGFEWRDLKDLQPNPNKSSKVKWCLYR